MITWSPDHDDLSWCDDSARLLHSTIKDIFNPVLEKIHKVRGVFPSAGFKQINCLLSTWFSSQKKTTKKTPLLSRPHCYWEGSLVPAHMRPYFLLSEARWWQRVANNRSPHLNTIVSPQVQQRRQHQLPLFETWILFVYRLLFEKMRYIIVA